MPSSPFSRRREVRHPAIDLPTKPESFLTIFIDQPAEAHIDRFIPANVQPVCRAGVPTDMLYKHRRRRTVDPFIQPSACAVKPEFSPAGLGGFVLRRILDFGLPSSTWAGKPPGVRSCWIWFASTAEKLNRTTDEIHFKLIRGSSQHAFPPARKACL